MIEVKNLSKKFGNHLAVDSLSFRVEKGQIYGFLGPNGAGKSTTMNMITGYLAMSNGTVTIDGVDIVKEPEEAKKKIGYLPELPPLYMDMTVKEYLNFAAELKKVAAKEKKAQVEKVMEMTGIADMKERLIKNLSKGYRQRVGLAQAILGDPEVLILDEPSVGLDPKQIIEMRELIRSLGESHTIILSSHILSEVSAICDHIMIISHGKLVASDSPEGLKNLLQGSLQITAKIKGSYAEISSALMDVEGIEGVEELGTQTVNDTEISHIRIAFQTKRDEREAVFYALANAKLPILELLPQEKSLEDIFLELTNAETAEQSSLPAGEADAETAKQSSLPAGEADAEATKQGSFVTKQTETARDEMASVTDSVSEDGKEEK